MSMPMIPIDNLKQIVESLLMASEEPLSIEKLYKIFCSNDNLIEISALRDTIKELVDDYADSSIELKEVASGWRFQIRSELSPWVNKLYEERPPKYSRALLETLALIAYRQPITRAEIEDVRGVGVSSNIIKTLLEHEWIRIVGYKEVPGKPALFATTKKFLDHFNLKHLDELPTLMEFTENITLENMMPSVALPKANLEDADQDIDKDIEADNQGVDVETDDVDIEVDIDINGAKEPLLPDDKI